MQGVRMYAQPCLNFGFPVVCLVIGFLLGSMLETSLRQSMLLYKSNFWVISESPIALGFLILTLVVLLKAAFKL